jgi:hypothetical protein
MAYLVDSVAGDVLRTIAVEKLKSLLVGVLCTVGNAAQFSVLHPQITLEQLGRRNETKNRGVSPREAAAFIFSECCCSFA